MSSETLLRCRAWSGSLSAFCDLPYGHPGDHQSAGDVFAAYPTPAVVGPPKDEHSDCDGSCGRHMKSVTVRMSGGPLPYAEDEKALSAEMCRQEEQRHAEANRRLRAEAEERAEWESAPAVVEGERKRKPGMVFAALVAKGTEAFFLREQVARQDIQIATLRASLARAEIERGQSAVALGKTHADLKVALARIKQLREGCDGKCALDECVCEQAARIKELEGSLRRAEEEVEAWKLAKGAAEMSRRIKELEQERDALREAVLGYDAAESAAESRATRLEEAPKAVVHQLRKGEASEGDARDIAWCADTLDAALRSDGDGGK